MTHLNMATSNNEKIVEILRKKGPLLSDEIIQRLYSKYNLTRQSAVKALSRVFNPIRRIDNIRFPHNKKFFYLDPLGYEEKNKLYKYCVQYNTAEGLILNALMIRDGICLAKYLPIVSGLPVKRVKNQRLFKEVVLSLEKNDMIIKSKDEYSSEEFYHLYTKKNDGYSNSKFFLLLEDKVLEQLKILFTKLNFTSTDSVQIRSENNIPIYGNFNWSLVGPCYLDGIKIGNKNGFLCCDIFLKNRLNKDNIKPILRKYNTSKLQQRNVRIIPAIFFQSITKPLLIDLRKKGFLTISVKTFGGDELLQLLEELVSLYTNINNKRNTGEETAKLIKKAFNYRFGIANNIKGYLFNFIVKNIFDLEYNRVEMSKTVQHNLQSKEIDVYFEDEKIRYIVECKAWSNVQNKQEEIKRWIDNKYEFFINWNNAKNKKIREKKLKIYFIVSDKNENIMKNLNNKFKEYSLMEFYDQKFLDELAKRYNQKEIRSALKCFITK